MIDVQRQALKEEALTVGALELLPLITCRRFFSVPFISEMFISQQNEPGQFKCNGFPI
jgi:hypothetical protein